MFYRVKYVRLVLLFFYLTSYNPLSQVQVSYFSRFGVNFKFQKIIGEADLVASIDQVAIDTVDAPVPTPTPTPTPTPAPISFASSKVEGIEGASTPTPTPTPASSPSSLTFLGAMLFQRCVSGCRVVVSNPDPARAANTIIANHTFKNWGSHLDYYPYSYFTVACSIGTTEKEVESFLRKADKTIMEFKKNQSKKPL